MERPGERPVDLKKPARQNDTAFHASKKQCLQRERACRFCVEQIERLDYNIRLLRAFTNERGKIVPRRISGVCARHQRLLAEAIKNALLPFGTDADDERCIESTSNANAPRLTDLLEQRSKLLGAMSTRQLTARESRKLDLLNKQLEKIEIQEADDLDRAYGQGRARRIEIALDRLGVMIEQLAYRPRQSSKPYKHTL
jgi:small subunit ribosomal protein S18